MKKLVSLLVALMMLVSCTAALATTTTGIYPEVDVDTAIALASMFDTDGTNQFQELVRNALALVNNMGLEITCGTNVISANLTLGEDSAYLAGLTGVVDEKGITVVSDMFPSYALYVDAEALQQMMPVDANAMAAGEDSAAEIASLLTPYFEDSMSVASAIVPEQTDEGVTYSITAGLLAEELNLWTARFAADTALQEVLNTALQAASNAGTSVSVDFNEMLTSVSNVAAQMSASPDTVVGTVIVGNDGSIVFDLMGMLYFSMESLIDNEGNPYTYLLMVNDPEMQGNYEAVLSAINAGEWTEGIAVDAAIVVNGTETDVALNLHLEGSQYGLSFVFDGKTETYNWYTMLGVDIGLGIDLVELHFVNVDSEEPVAPSIEGLTVINALTMTEEEKAALLTDVQNYGIATLLVNATTAMPDEVTVILNTLMGGTTTTTVQ